jgi:hypothetical protein
LAQRADEAVIFGLLLGDKATWTAFEGSQRAPERMASGAEEVEREWPTTAVLTLPLPRVARVEELVGRVVGQQLQVCAPSRYDAPFMMQLPYPFDDTPSRFDFNMASRTLKVTLGVLSQPREAPAPAPLAPGEAAPHARVIPLGDCALPTKLCVVAALPRVTRYTQLRIRVEGGSTVLVHAPSLYPALLER